MGSLSTFVKGLSMAMVAGMAVNMGVAVAEPPPPVRGTAVMVGAKMERVVADEVDADAVDPASFLADLFGEHFGVRYVPGSSGLATTVAGATVDGQEIPVELIADYEAAGFPVLRRWSVQVLSQGRVVAQAAFTETSRIATPGLAPAGIDLHAHGIASSTRVIVSGFARNAAGEEREVFGVSAEVRLLGGGTVSTFTPVGAAAAEVGAVAAAARLADDFNGITVAVPEPDPVPPGPVPGPGPGGGGEDVEAICAERRNTCYQVARTRYEGCILQAAGISAACVGACVPASFGCGPFAPACMAACGAACITAEVLMMESCVRTLNADRLVCDQAYRDCIRNGGR